MLEKNAANIKIENRKRRRCGRQTYVGCLSDNIDTFSTSDHVFKYVQSPQNNLSRKNDLICDDSNGSGRFRIHNVQILSESWKQKP